MPVYRTPDGKIVEEKTVKEDETEQKDLPPPPPAEDGGDDEEMGSGFDAPTQRISEKPEAPPDEEAEAGADQAAESKKGDKAEQAPAKKAGKKAEPDESESEDADADRTRLAGARRRKTKPAAEEAGEEAPQDAMDDPLVGWLVVVDGPGQGSGLRLGYGANTIGRSGTMRVQLDFGDGQISRDKHAIVTYDPRSRKWFVQHGGGKNLTYVNGAPVLQATELAPSDEIQIGDTTIRLAPFCGPDFDWQDKEESA